MHVQVQVRTPVRECGDTGEMSMFGRTGETICVGLLRSISDMSGMEGEASPASRCRFVKQRNDVARPRSCKEDGHPETERMATC